MLGRPIGTDAGQVVIWNLVPVLDGNAEDSENVTKKLCTLDNHLACVNSVRWSSSGSTLASGGDDKIIMLWNRGKGPTAVFGNTGITQCVENWRPTATLRGHSGDILDLAWSPQDKWLASSSIDNNIIVWDIQNAPNVTTVGCLMDNFSMFGRFKFGDFIKSVGCFCESRRLPF